MNRTASLVLVALALAPVGAAACPGSDLAITSLAVRNVTPTHYLNYYHVVATVTNVGETPEDPATLQFVDINQYGQRLDDRGIPPLRAGQSYSVAYVWKRASDAGTWTTPLSFHTRLISPASLDACTTRSNSSAIQF